MRILVVKPQERPAVREISGPLASMQELVGGLIQILYPFHEPVALVCNEEGKLQNLSLNRALRGEDGVPYDIVCGTFFLCSAPPDSDELESLSEEQVQEYGERFRTPEMFLSAGGKLMILSMDPDQ